METKSVPKFFLLAAMAILFSVKHLHAQAVESEPNNTAAQATIMPLNGSGSGALNNAGDADWWKVTTNADGALQITFNNTGNPDLKVVSLYDTGGVILIQNIVIGNGIAGFEQNGLAAGTYFIKINGSSGNETGNYILSNSLTVPVQANDKEPNNNFTQADRLDLNGSATGHYGYYYKNYRDTSDWYKLTTNSDGLIKLTLDNTGNSLALVSLKLYDNDGNTLLNQVQVGDGIAGFSTNGLAQGTYYIQITGNGDANAYGPYTLSDSLIRPAQANDQEPNNNRAQARVLKLNHNTTGHYGYYYNHSRDTADWYKLTTNTDGMIKLKLDNTGNSLALVTLRLYDNNGTTILNQAQVGDGIGVISTDGLAAGTYYIQITGNGDADSYGPYMLTDSLKTYNYAVDPEPDNHPYEANNLPLNSTVTGHVNFYYNNTKDTADWYKLVYTGSSGKLILTVKIAPSLIDNTVHGIHFEAYKDTTKAPVYAKTFFGAVNKLNVSSVPNGKYYIKIYSDVEASDFSAYSITDSVPPAPEIPEAVQNNPSINNQVNAQLTWNVVGDAVTNNAAVRLQLNENANISVQVISLAGNLIQNIHKGNMQKGTYTIPLNFTNTIAGMYIVHLIADGKLYSKNIMK